jgi:hypothetical protein
LLKVIEHQFGWALAIPIHDPEERRYYWYKSAENEEPRFGERNVEGGEDLTVDVVGDVLALQAALRKVKPEALVDEVLLAHPEMRPILTRVWAARNMAYHTPWANSTSSSFSPVDAMRIVLAGFKGLEKLYPISQRWVRAVMMQGAPTAAEVKAGTDESWAYPELPGQP